MTDVYSFEPDPLPRGVFRSLLRGARRRCPRCGTGAMLAGYLKVREACGECGAELHHQRADDAPPYFTIMIVGHLIIPGALLLERAAHPPTWVQYSIWLPLTLGLTLALLPRVKGALVGMQWALRMGGFDDGGDGAEHRASR